MKFFRKKIKDKYKRAGVTQNYIYLKQNKRRKRLMLRVFYFVFILFLFCFLFYAVFFTNYFNVKKLNFSGNNLVSDNYLEGIYFDYISEKRFFLDQKNIITLNKEDLKNTILNSHSRIKSVDVKMAFPDSLEFFISEFYPKGVLCRDKSCFYFDEDGVVFEKSPFILGKSLLSIKDDNLNIEKTPVKIYEKNTVNFLSDIKNLLEKDSNILIKHFLFLNSYGDIEIKTENGFKIFITMEQDSKFYSRAISELIKNEIKENLSRLDYIDLRIKGKAYYKLILEEESSLEGEEGLDF